MAGACVGRGVSQDALKAIALITMAIDHIGAVLFPDLLWIRLIGRIAFPIYVWLLIQGFLHTSSFPRYALRLGAFALLSELPFDLAFSGGVNWEDQNVFFMLLCCLLMLYVLRLIRRQERWPLWLRAAATLATVFAASSLAALGGFDYGFAGPVLAAGMYLLRGRVGVCISFLLFFAAYYFALRAQGYAPMLSVYNVAIEAFCLPSALLICLSNGRRRWRGAGGKWFFYAFYPAHLLLLYWIHLWVG